MYAGLGLPERAIGASRAYKGLEASDEWREELGVRGQETGVSENQKPSSDSCLLTPDSWFFSPLATFFTLSHASI